jgi:serine/threonine-protein kinase
MSADPENEYFCDGLADELSNALAKIDELKIVARTSAFSFKGKDTSISAIGEALGVRTILEGSVRKAGNRLRISVQLVNAADGYHIWSERYDRLLEDVFDVQDEITLAVVDVLKVKLLGDERAAALKRGTQDAEAYQLYLNGRFHWNERTAAALQAAVDFYRRAVDRDPNYALAYAGLAECYVLFSWLSVDPPRESMPKAKAAALRALELDDTLAEAHAALGVYLSFYEWNQPASERALRRAIDLKPNSASAVHWLGNVPLLAMGRFEESIAAERRAAELDPLSTIIVCDTGLSLFCARRFEEVAGEFQRVLALDAGFYVARYHLGLVHHARAMYDDAIAEFKSCLNATDDPWVRSLLGRALAKSGRRSEAFALRDELQVDATRRYVPNVGLAVLCAALDEMDEAFGWLERDVADRSLYPPFYGIDPVFDDFRDDPRFAEVLRVVERGAST